MIDHNDRGQLRPSECSLAGHKPDWNTVTVEHAGSETHVDVECGNCGRSGCIGVVEWKAENIDW